MPITEQNGTTSSDTLNGWKDIASYLNRSVRAVQRWERELGLPVHRIKATDGQTVYALRAEVDEWRKSRDLPKTLPEDADDQPIASLETEGGSGPGPAIAAMRSTTARPLWHWFAIALMACLLIGIGAAIGVVIARRVGPAGSIQVAGTSVVAYDSFGRVVWTKNFGRQVVLADGLAGRSDTVPMFVDLDGDSQAEAIVPLRFSMGGKPSTESDALVAFDAKGNTRWMLQPDLRIRCGSELFEGPWRIYAVRASAGPGLQRLWVAFNHSTWWPGLVMEVTATGQPLMKMLHTGWVSDLAEWRTPSGVFLAVAGFNNERVRPTVSLIDPDAKATMSPHSESRFSCEGAPEAMPQHVYLLPILDTEIQANAFARAVTVLASTLKVQINNDPGYSIVQIATDLRVTDFSITDTYWAAHRLRELEGNLRHPAEACPERTKPQPIDEWTVATGWRSSTIMPTVRQGSPRK